MNQSIIMPYHRNKDMLKYTIAQLDKFIDRDVEIIIVGNNTDAKELDVDLPSRVNYVKIPRSMLYSETVNMGVDMAKGEIITLCDQDIFSFSNWYVPLIKKLTSDPNIGSVSSKLIEPPSGRIIDFGIEYSKKHIVHTLRGHKYSHPLAQIDRSVTSTTSATLMTYKSLYKKVGGMDTDMPYCCSDCDIGLKFLEEGFENWVVADSVAFHRGSSSRFNGKMLSFNHLKEESHIMFWRRNSDNPLFPTVGRDINNSVNYISSTKRLKPLYTMINLSTTSEYEWYASEFRRYAECDISDIHSYKAGQNNYRDSIQLYDSVPYFFMDYSMPLIYFVDYFPSLRANKIWQKMRNIENDLVLDIAGNLVFLKDIINGAC